MSLSAVNDATASVDAQNRSLASVGVTLAIYDGYVQPHARVIEGALRGGRRMRPITVWVVEDSGQFVVSEPLYHMHSYGMSLSEALEDFRSVVADELEALEECEEHLAPQLRDQLTYLRSIVAPA